MKKEKYSNLHLKYIKKVKRDTLLVYFFRVTILLFFIGFWEIFAKIGLIDSFITSSPSKILITIKNLWIENNLLYIDCSIAMNNLNLLYAHELSDFIKKIDSTLYIDE